MELDQGGIYIDGLEVSKLGLAQLRNAMAIIPQVTHRHGHLVILSMLGFLFLVQLFVAPPLGPLPLQLG